MNSKEEVGTYPLSCLNPHLCEPLWALLCSSVGTPWGSQVGQGVPWGFCSLELEVDPRVDSIEEASE